MVTKNINKPKAASIAALLLLGGAASSYAVLIANGGSVPNVGVPAEAAGVVINSTLTGGGAVAITGIFDIDPTSTISEFIVRRAAGAPGDPDGLGPLVGGGLDFYFQIKENAGAGFSGRIHQFNANFYGSSVTSTFLTDVVWDNTGLPVFGFANPAGALIPDSFGRSAGGNSVQFNFPELNQVVFGGDGPIVPGSISKWMVIRTNALDYAPGIGGVINGITQNFPILGPAIPEPTSALFGLGILSALGWSRRRRQQSSGSVA